MRLQMQATVNVVNIYKHTTDREKKTNLQKSIQFLAKFTNRGTITSAYLHL